MSELGDAQREFTWMVGQLIQFAYNQGYALTFGCARCVKEGHHMKNSLHYSGLAIDFNLYIRGADGGWHYTKRSEDHILLGQFWETMGGAWGGRFKSPDGNHYSKAFGGRK